MLARVAELEARQRPRWAWWEATSTYPALIDAGISVGRCWDIREAHRLLHGGFGGSPAEAATILGAGLPRDSVPILEPGVTGLGMAGLSSAGPRSTSALGHGPGGRGLEEGPDLFHLDGTAPDNRVGSEGRAAHGPAGSEVATWAQTLWSAATAQRAALGGISPRAVRTCWSESAAAALCVELQDEGLPVDRAELERLIALCAGPRPRTEAEAARTRAERDARVLRHAPGRERTDLRNPAQVKALLAGAGIDVPDTRKWRLEPYRAASPLVDALLRWRVAERVATTYGYHWLDAHVGADDRLRGRWSACDGAGGRMTAQNGLHNLPAGLRGGIAAAPGHVFVRADLGQVEPRVLAAVSGDPAFAAAARADDLYAPVAQALGLERSTAKVAVLAALYGQRTGSAGAALQRMERAFPTAFAYLDEADRAGYDGRPMRTYGGRLIVPGPIPDRHPRPDLARAARGRFVRNAVVQGAAAELFKTWAATVRAALPRLGGRIVLCLHDELLVHVPEDAGQAAARVVVESLETSARFWTESSEVRFVADVAVIRRWSEAKP